MMLFLILGISLPLVGLMVFLANYLCLLFLILHRGRLLFLCLWYGLILLSCSICPPILLPFWVNLFLRLPFVLSNSMSALQLLLLLLLLLLPHLNFYYIL